MLYRCQTACQNSKSWKNSTIMNDARTFTYGGLFNYDNNQLKGWLDALYNRNGDNVERAAVAEYRERCKNTKGYEFLDDKPQKPRTRIEITVALYSLKIGGTNGVDTNNRNSIGSIGKLAYIDRNGERHEYPASALSFTATKDQKGLSYINMGNYLSFSNYLSFDTRSDSDTTYIQDFYHIRQYWPNIRNYHSHSVLGFLFEEHTPHSLRVYTQGIYNHFAFGDCNWGLADFQVQLSYFFSRIIAVRSSCRMIS